MERIMSQEERIKRAEEIYQRRKNQDVRINTGTNLRDSGKPEISLFKNLIFKIVVCTVIYTCLYTIKNSNYFFTNDVINNVNEILSHDINFNELYKNVSLYFSSLNQNINKNKDENLYEEHTENNSENETGDNNNESTQSNENAEKEENILQKENPDGAINEETVNANETINIEKNQDIEGNTNENIDGILNNETESARNWRK